MTQYPRLSQTSFSNVSEFGLSTRVFDETAAGWGAAIDQSIQKGRYLRGELFVNAISCRLARGSFILDYGCGPGRISLMLARNGFRVLGLDPSANMIAMARRQPLGTLDVEFRLCSEYPVEPPEIPYSGIICSSVIEYVAEPEQLLRWFATALRTSGILIISFANSRSIWGAWCRFHRTSAFRAAHRHMWSWPRFHRLLERNGFASEGHVIYFESPLDRIRHLRTVSWSPLCGTLGLVVARRCKLSEHSVAWCPR